MKQNHDYPEQWKAYESFLADVGPKPGDNFILGRRDNRIPHSPLNTYWVDPATYDDLACEHTSRIDPRTL